MRFAILLSLVIGWSCLVSSAPGPLMTVFWQNFDPARIPSLLAMMPFLEEDYKEYIEARDSGTLIHNNGNYLDNLINNNQCSPPDNRPSEQHVSPLNFNGNQYRNKMMIHNGDQTIFNGVPMRNDEILHVMVDRDQLVSISGIGNYGLSGSELEEDGIRTVSVNGENVTLITDTCETSSKTMAELNDSEKSLISAAKAKLVKASNQPAWPPSKQCVSRFSRSSSRTNCMRLFLSDSNGLFYGKIDDEHFTLSKSYLPNNLERVFVLGENVGFVQKDMKVALKPRKCLSLEENQLVEQLREEITKSETESQQGLVRMRDDLSSRIGEMNTNIRNQNEGLSRMNNNLQMQMTKSFGRGFSFN